MKFSKLLYITLFFILLNNTVYADYRYRYKAGGSILGQFDNKNLPPIINTLSVDNAFKDGVYLFTLDGSDPNGDTLLWSWSGDTIPNTNLNSLTGEISGTPTTAGDYTFTINLDDQNGEVVSKQYTVSVLDCTTGPIGTLCADGAIYIGDSGGSRTYMAGQDLSGKRSWGLNGFDVAGTPIASAMNYNIGNTITNAMSPAYDNYNDGTRIGTGGMDCRNELGTEWYLPAYNEFSLMKNARTSLTTEQQNTYVNDLYLTSSYNYQRNNTSDRTSLFLARNPVTGIPSTTGRTSLWHVRCFRK